MNKYLKYYFLDSLLIIAVSIGCYYIVQDNIYDIVGTYTCNKFLVILSIISLLLNVIFLLIKKPFKEENLLFPKFYLLFTLVIIILALIMNRYLYFKYIHLGYYYGFIIFNYLLLSLYTNLSYNFNNKKNK